MKTRIIQLSKDLTLLTAGFQTGLILLSLITHHPLSWYW